MRESEEVASAAVREEERVQEEVELSRTEFLSFRSVEEYEKAVIKSKEVKYLPK